ncbi:MAG TPA: DUF1802 family protein [Nostocaceae cyanobacterium]|nr:DUF1802 family protein [Nostocaceae cyanobacterium]
MSESTVIYTALSLPLLDIEALIQGEIIAAMPRKFITPGQRFALFPTALEINSISEEKYYRSDFLSSKQQLNTDEHSTKSIIKAWAKCELCQMLNNRESLDALSTLTIWTKAAFEEILNQRPYIFLAYLRVYLLDEFLEIELESQSRQFIPLPNFIPVSDAKPILDDETFTQRKKRLENLEVPLQPELSKIVIVPQPTSETQPVSPPLIIEPEPPEPSTKDDEPILPDPITEVTTNTLYSDSDWIYKIAEIGNSSNGHEFERLVRKSLIKLGFSCSNTNPKANLDPHKLGGAGGVDFYCEYPYPVVGECKATKTEKVSDGTPAQLLKLGLKHLGTEQYELTVKLIFAAGELTNPALNTAKELKMNVISPETLQKLVEIQSHYKNSVNLIELKECLEQKPYGLADDKVNGYIKKIEHSIKLRSHIIQLVKKHLEKTTTQNADISTLNVAYIYDHPPQSLTITELYEILIELASPLTGYLGRVKGKDWTSDRFYYLRDLE